MFNEHSVKASHHEDPFLYTHVHPIAATNPTTVNVIIPIIPEPTRKIMDLVLLVAGVNLNAFLGLFIVLTSMPNSTDCYIVGLVFSSFVILLEPLERTFEWLFDIHLEMNLDYVFLMSFGTTILTITMLNIEAYIVICQKNSPLRKTFLKVSTAVKGILFIWTTCMMMIAMELHLYDFFEEKIMSDIYVCFTVMFLLFPGLIFIMLDYFILYEMTITKSISGMWPTKELEHFIFLIGINVTFFITMAPYRIVRSINLITQSYHAHIMIEITYTMIKIYPIIQPIICFASWKELQRTLKRKLLCSQHKISVII